MTRGPLIGVLGGLQILAWGTSYYLLAVLAGPIHADTDWPLASIVAGLSLGLIAAGLVSPRVGRMIERDGGRRPLAAGALLIGLGQIGLALSPSLPMFWASWLVLGAGMGAGLYDAAFATLGRLYGRDARRAITTLTLFGGFASTLLWPLSALLCARFGWRWTCASYAAIQFAVSAPLYLFALPARVPPRVPETGALPASGPPPRGIGGASLLAATLTLSAAISSTLSVHLLPILQARGASVAEAVSLGAIVGPCQVVARAIEMGLSRRHHPIWTKLASVGSVAIGVVALGAGLGPVAGALLFYGAGIGLESIARGALPLALYGAPGYATLMGRLAMPSLIAQAASPWLAALVIGGFGPNSALAALVLVALVNLALTLRLLNRWAATSRHRAAASI